MSANASDLLTLGDLNREVPDVPRHRLTYAIDTYGIEPRQRAGIIRLWHRDDLPRIKSALRRIAEGRGLQRA